MMFATIIAPNYWPYARVLAASIAEHHPDVPMVVLVLVDGDVDEPEPRSGNRVTVLRPADLGIERSELHLLAAMYNVTELATALKPRLLAHLLTLEPTVTYLDPDIQVFAPLESVVTLAERNEMVVTPHSVSPMIRDGLLPNEYQVLRSGIFNLGFIAVGPRSVPFLRWWEERLRHDCVVSLEDGLFVDQRWVDLASIYFPPAIVRDETCNVAYWNLDSRHISWVPDQFLVNGRPLSFYHFSGFDPRHPDVITRHVTGRSRVTLGTNSALRLLFEQYAARLRASGFGEVEPSPYAFAASSGGVALTRQVRRLYRDHIVAGNGPPPPDPFDPNDEHRFVRWRRRALEGDAIGRWRAGPTRRAVLTALPEPAQRLIWRAQYRLRSPGAETSNRAAHRVGTR